MVPKGEKIGTTRTLLVRARCIDDSLRVLVNLRANQDEMAPCLRWNQVFFT